MGLKTADWFGVILGGLIVITFAAGLLKLYLNKKKLERDTKAADLEAASKINGREKFAGRKPREGDLFGVRAIQHGYFGGVAQSRDGSQSPSNYSLSPSTKIADWNKLGHKASPSTSSSVSEYLSQNSQNLSVTSLPRIPEPVKHKPSPLRLHPSDAESIRPSTAISPTNVGGIGGSYMPPPPSPRTFGRDSPAFDKEKAWVAPLDVHFGKPSAPQSASRPTSYLPRLNFPGQIEKTAIVHPAPTGSLHMIKSEAASIVSSDSIPPRIPIYGQFTSKPSPFSNEASSHSSQPSQFSTRSDFPFPSSTVEVQPLPRWPPVEKSVPEQQIILSSLPPQLASIDPNLFPQDSRHHRSTSAIIRDSIVSKQRVSIYRPTRAEETFPDSPTSPHRAHSIAASSIYSSRTSIHEDINDSPTNSIPRLPSPEPEPQPRTSRSRSRSTSKSRSNSTKSLARTHDSIRLHSRKQSQESIKPSQKRHSKERDSLYYDPSQARRNRSGSVQGRNVDFDRPRESPFSNSNAISDHSANSSISSSTSETPRSTFEPFSLKAPILDLPLFDQDRLSIHTLSSRHKGKTPSETSQGSIGDFYDAYYRNSTMAQRASGASQTLGNYSNVIPVHIPTQQPTNSGAGTGRRPPPLKLGPDSLGGSWLATETIMELPTPNASPMPPNRHVERFPSMI